LIHNIFDPVFNGLGGGEMYRAAVIPDLYPDQKPWRLENWSEDERELDCGIYTPERRAELMAAAAAKAAA